MDKLSSIEFKRLSWEEWLSRKYSPIVYYQDPIRPENSGLCSMYPSEYAKDYYGKDYVIWGVYKDNIHKVV